MSAETPAARRPRTRQAKPAPEPAPLPAEVETDALPRLPAGWRIIATKEFADHILSVRFFVLLLVLGLAAAIPLYFAADQIRSVAPQASGTRAVFLALFWFGSPDISILTVATFVAIVAPLLGLAFAFDAVNGERSEGTLPRLLSQPIYRDDVINGKFAAGLAVIGLVLVAVVLLISGFGMLRLGIVPHGEEVIRLIAWVLATFLYVALWLAFGLLLSVAVRRAATSALIGFGIWLVFTIFGPLIVTAGPGVHHPGRERHQRPDPGHGPGPRVHLAAAAEPALRRHLERAAATRLRAQEPLDPGHARAVPAGPAADPGDQLARPEPAARVAPGGRAGRADGRLLRGRVRAVHAPGGPRLGVGLGASTHRHRASI